MTDYANFIYPAGLVHGNKLKLQPDKTWMDYAKKLADKHGTVEDSDITAEEASDFLWNSIKAAIDMISAKKTYEEYILETALQGVPKWAQITEKVWQSLSSDVVFSM